ncbi:helix-turn-helix transcriptional regulator [Ottowia testudinis]|uniref:Helix-turn-helix transcriptional regulator n=1 Tax=Ottowia testudinis TaxID=2816950 RepID=A0A975H323_9BURK|nr:AraC family transcriptional regulator [Ottowia testudinis]QTD45453.1 helix-turn-helix transcriptional regulator [Ottowia testudinis]
MEPIRSTHFHHPRLDPLGVEVLTLDELRHRVAPGRWRAPGRVDFHLLLLVTGGRGAHTVDFVHHPLAHGDLLNVRPGQVQQWHPGTALHGLLLLATPLALLPDRLGGALPDAQRLAMEAWPCVHRPAPAEAQALRHSLQQMAADIQTFDGDARTAALVRHSLLALWLRVARGLPASPGEGAAPHSLHAVHRLFARELERHFADRLGVADYARRLGYSESTLARACHAAAGQSPKQLIDARTVLEARRLLAHSPASVGAIGHRLGFSEATNFNKFFTRLAGCTPLAFRRQQKIQSPVAAQSSH